LGEKTLAKETAMTTRAQCAECGWEGEWERVWVEMPDPNDPDRTVIGPDPDRTVTEPPYYCPACGEDMG
jgi:predicted RNA-binding Zn-ribbon protein involved in translation (DUF1610 family)